MLKKLLALALVVLVAGVAAGFVGLGPVPGGDSGTDIESFPTETPGSSNDGSVSDATTTAAPPFAFTIDHVETCGETCRDVTTTLTNEQSTSASDVTVYTRIYAGTDTDGDAIWEGTESVGDLDAGESYTATERVELSLADAYAVEQEDGWITVQTTAESDGETMTFTERRQVA